MGSSLLCSSWHSWYKFCLWVCNWQGYYGDSAHEGGKSCYSRYRSYQPSLQKSALWSLGVVLFSSLPLSFLAAKVIHLLDINEYSLQKSYKILCISTLYLYLIENMKFTQCIELKLFIQLYIIKSIFGSYWSKLLVNLLVFNMFLVSFNHGNNLFRKWKHFVS